MVAAAVGAAAATASAANSISNSGSKSSGGTSANTTTSTTTLDPEIRSRLLNLIDRGQGIADTPYPVYGNDRVAKFNQDQTDSFGAVRDFAGIGVPTVRDAQDLTRDATGYTREAGDLTRQAMTGPLSLPEIDLGKYMNPFTDLVAGNVTNELGRLNTMQNMGLDAKAAGAGAFGGDRATLAKTEQNRNFSTTLGNTLSGIYLPAWAQASSNAETDLSRRADVGLRGAGQLNQFGAQMGQYGAQLGQLGSLEQTLGLQGAAALGDIGRQQQDLQQRGLDVGYSNYLDQRNWPFYTTNFLAGIMNGSPVNRAGSTSVTPPAPSLLGQIAGIGAAGAGLAGMSGFSGFGQTYNPFSAPASYDAPYNYFNSDLGAGVDPGFIAAAQAQAINNPLTSYARGGFVGEAGPGWLTPLFAPPREDGIAGFADGGDVGDDDDDEYGGTADDDGDDGISGSEGDDELVGGAGADNLGGGIAGGYPVGATRDMVQGQGRTGGTADAGIAAAPAPSEKEVQSTIKRVVGKPGAEDVPSWALPLAAAGFAAMASKSPFALSQIGEGGIAGISAYMKQEQLKTTKAYRESQAALKQQQIDQTGAYHYGQLLNTADRTAALRERTAASNDPETRQAKIDAINARAAASRASAAKHYSDMGKDNFVFGSSFAGEQADPNDPEKMVKGVFMPVMNKATGVPELTFVAGGTKGATGAPKGTALERNTDFVASVIAKSEGRDKPNDEDRKNALAQVQQGKPMSPGQRANYERNVLKDLRAANDAKPKKQQLNEVQLQAEAKRQADEGWGRASQAAAPPSAAAPSAPARVPGAVPPQPLPRNAAGKIDRDKLKKDGIYQIPDRGPMKFDGRELVPVQ